MFLCFYVFPTDIAGSGILTHTITNERLARRGYYDISEAYKSLHDL